MSPMLIHQREGSAVYIYGDLMIDHGIFEVELDGERTETNGRAGYMVQGSVLFFKAGLSANATHHLTVTNRESKYLDIERLVALSLDPPCVGQRRAYRNPAPCPQTFSDTPLLLTSLPPPTLPSLLNLPSAALLYRINLQPAALQPLL